MKINKKNKKINLETFNPPTSTKGGMTQNLVGFQLGGSIQNFPKKGRP